jgi:multicomponent Na+:H+ antiporter subunit E
MNGLALSRTTSRAALSRAAVFLVFWVLLTGFKAADLAVGALAALLAAWVSLHLLPPGGWKLLPVRLAGYALRFLYQSIIAGADVAWRALDPRMPLRPGFVVYRSKLPAGTVRDGFCTVSSLLPGTLPSGTDADDALSIHCLDTAQPIAEQLALEEARFVAAIGASQTHV